MGSHSVTCHPTEVRISPLPSAEAGTRFSDPGGMQGWVDLCYVKADRPGIEPATCKSQVQRRTAKPPRNSSSVVSRTCFLSMLTGCGCIWFWRRSFGVVERRRRWLCAIVQLVWAGVGRSIIGRLRGTVSCGGLQQLLVTGCAGWNRKRQMLYGAEFCGCQWLRDLTRHCRLFCPRSNCEKEEAVCCRSRSWRRASKETKKTKQNLKMSDLCFVVVRKTFLSYLNLHSCRWKCAKSITSFAASNCYQCCFIFRSTPLSRPNKVGLKCSFARSYARPSTKSFFDLNDIWYVGKGRWVMHDGIQYDLIQGKGQGNEPLKVGHFFKGYLHSHL